MLIDGREASHPLIVNGVSYVTIKEISDLLDLELDWNDIDRIIYLNSQNSISDTILPKDNITLSKALALVSAATGIDESKFIFIENDLRLDESYLLKYYIFQEYDDIISYYVDKTTSSLISFLSMGPHHFLLLD